MDRLFYSWADKWGIPPGKGSNLSCHIVYLTL